MLSIGANISRKIININKNEISKEEFVALVEEHKLSLYRFAKSILKNDIEVEDAIKDAKGQIYAAAQNKDNIGKELTNEVKLNYSDINLNGEFNLEVDQTLRSAMEDNASRAGVKLDNFGWKSYGDDKKALESNLATSHKIGGKNS